MNEDQAAALRLAAQLLAYPNPSWVEKLPDFAQAAAGLARSGDARVAKFGETALAFIERERNLPQKELAKAYAAIFDNVPEASLYMTWQRYGKTGMQGQAMGALNGLYQSAGFEPEAGEMPDYLPIMLRFLSSAPDWASKIILAGFGPELKKLQQNLLKLDEARGRLLQDSLAPLAGAFPESFKPRLEELKPGARGEGRNF